MVGREGKGEKGTEEGVGIERGKGKGGQER